MGVNRIINIKQNSSLISGGSRKTEHKSLAGAGAVGSVVCSVGPRWDKPGFLTNKMFLSVRQNNQLKT